MDLGLDIRREEWLSGGRVIQKGRERVIVVVRKSGREAWRERNIRARVSVKIEDINLETALQTWVLVVKVRKQKLKTIK